MKDLQSRIQGEVLTPAPEHYARDFGGLERVPARWVVRPKTIEDVQETVRMAAQKGVRIVVRGHGCSSTGIVLGDEVVLDMIELKYATVGDGPTVTAGPGLRWSELQEELIPHGRSVRVMVNNPWASIGGTLAVGGYGSTSFRYGAQANQVKSLDIVTANGEIVHAVREGAHADLLRYTLGGLGQTGVIVRAELETCPLKVYTSLVVRCFPDTVPINSVVDEVLAEKPDECLVTFDQGMRAWQIYVGHNLEHRPTAPPSGGMWFEYYHRIQYILGTEYRKAQTEMLMEEGLVTREEDVRHIWGDFFLPADKAQDYFEALRGIIDDRRATRGFYGSAFTTAKSFSEGLPLLPFPPGADRVITFGPYCVLPPSWGDEYKARFDRAADACLAAGGRLYLYGYHPRTDAFYRRQFGDAIVDRWRAVKAQYDPGNMFGTPIFN